MFYNFLWTFNKEKPCVCIRTLLHYLLWCSFVWLWSHLVRHSRFRLSGKDARVRSCKGKSSKVRGQRSWSAKIWRQRVKKRRCAVAKAKKRYFYIAYLLRNCALSSSHLHTFDFTFFSLHTDAGTVLVRDLPKVLWCYCAKCSVAAILPTIN